MSDCERKITEDDNLYHILKKPQIESQSYFIVDSRIITGLIDILYLYIEINPICIISENLHKIINFLCFANYPLMYIYK